MTSILFKREAKFRAYKISLGLLVVLIISIVFSLIVSTVSSQAQIWTGDEQGDIVPVFAPNENVYIRGSGFNPTAQINIIITRPDNLVENYATSSDENGCFLYEYILDGMIGTYSITATDGVNSDNTTFDEPLRILEGYDGSSARWVRGQLNGWNELDWVPYRIEFAKLPTGTSNFTFNVYHNNLLGSVSGFDGLENFWVGDVNGNPVSGSVTVSGPFYKTPGKNCDQDIYYSLSVTFNTPSSGMNWYVYWDAHLAIGSSGWPGSKLHSYADISGSQVIPLTCPPRPSGSISGAKWNDSSYNGVWDSGEPGLSNWTIQLYFFDPVKNSWINIDNETTGSGGCYTFSRLAAGNYRVNEVLKANWIQTYPASPGIYNITLSNGQNINGINFGNVLATRGANVSISPGSKSGLNGATLTYTVTVTNTGNVSDTFNLMATDNSGWSENVSPTSLTLSPGGNGNATLSVTIPSNAMGGAVDNVTVTATDNGVSASASCTAQVTVTRGVNVTISPGSQNGTKGATLTYTVTVSNTGNVTDTYTLAATDNAGWSPSVPASKSVPAFSSDTVTLSVTIPLSAVGGAIDNIKVTATGTGDNSSANCTAQVTIRGVNVTISPSSQNGANGGTLTYTVTVNNTGNVTDTYNLTATNTAGWSENVSPTSLTIPAFNSLNATLSVTIPSNAIGGTIDNITVTATGTGDNSSANCTAQVTITRGVNVTISPSSQNGTNGTVLTYTVIVNNTGNVPETYNLTATDNAGWSPSVPTSISVPAFSSDNTKTLSVTIPQNAMGGAIDNITVMATDNGVSASANCTAHITITRDVSVTISPGSQSGLNGATLTYTVTGNNTGNVTDTYNLTATNTAGWSENVSPTSLTIPPFNSLNATLGVTIPSNAIGGTTDNIKVTATGTGDNSSANCTAQVTITRGVNVSISPSSQNGTNGAILAYTVTVSSTGNVPETYNLTATDNAGWTENISPASLSVPAWSSRTTTLSVSIPPNAIGGTIDNVTVTATDNGVSASANCTAQVTVTRGVNITISPSSKSGTNGAVLAYTVTVINTGNVPDTYNLTPTDNSGWSPSVSPTPITVPAWENRTTTLDVMVPINAMGGRIDNITVTAMDNGVSASANCTAQVTITRDVSVSILPSYQGGFDGEIIIYTVTVVNVGNVADNYDVMASDNLGWDNIWLEDSALQVAGFDSENTTLHVRIPDNAVYCTKDNVTVTAISRTDNTVKDNNSCIAHAASIIEVDVSISPVLDNGLNKYVTITNMGNVVDNYNLTVEDNSGWTLMLVENQFGNVIPGENRVTTLNIDIPENTRTGTVNSVTAVATSKEHAGVSDNATAVVAAIRNVEVSISPTENDGLHGDKLVYTVTVSNTGNVADNYYLTKSDVLGWTASDNFAWLSIAPGHFDSVNFEITVPDNARPGVEDAITITAVSQIDNTVSGSDSCIAQSRIIRGVNVSISPGENEALAGGNLSFTVTILNTGNVPDNYVLENIDALGWNLALSESLLENIPDGTSRNVTLTVAIPNGVWGRTFDNVTVFATSLENENASDSESCLAKVKVLPGVDVQITPGWQENLFGGNLTYTITVINTGNAVDNYALTAVDDAGWITSFSDNLVADNRIENLAPGENRIVTLNVIISENWMGYTDDSIVVTAASNENANIRDNASCLAHGIPCTGTASIRLAITGSSVPYLWGTSKAKVTADLKVYTGGNLRLLFLTADNKTVESEAVIWSRTISGVENASFTDMIVLHDNHLPYPVDIIKRVKMVLTDNVGNVILDNMAWYTPVQDDWSNRITWIILNWWNHTAAEQDQLSNEITQIILNWGNCPTTHDQGDFSLFF